MMFISADCWGLKNRRSRPMNPWKPICELSGLIQPFIHQLTKIFSLTKLKTVSQNVEWLMYTLENCPCCNIFSPKEVKEKEECAITLLTEMCRFDRQWKPTNTWCPLNPCVYFLFFLNRYWCINFLLTPGVYL